MYRQLKMISIFSTFKSDQGIKIWYASSHWIEMRLNDACNAFLPNRPQSDLLSSWFGKKKDLNQFEPTPFINRLLDPRGRPSVTACSHHYFLTRCPSVLPSTFQYLAKQNNCQVRIGFTTGGTVGLAEWIIDDTCHLNRVRFLSRAQKWYNLNWPINVATHPPEHELQVTNRSLQNFVRLIGKDEEEFAPLAYVRTGGMRGGGYPSWRKLCWFYCRAPTLPKKILYHM